MLLGMLHKRSSLVGLANSRGVSLWCCAQENPRIVGVCGGVSSFVFSGSST